MMRKGITHPMNPPITALDKLKEIEREVRLRRGVYDRMVKEGRMTVPEAARKIGIMVAIAEDYRGMLGGRLQLDETQA